MRWGVLPGAVALYLVLCGSVQWQHVAAAVVVAALAAALTMRAAAAGSLRFGRPARPLVPPDLSLSEAAANAARLFAMAAGSRSLPAAQNDTKIAARSPLRRAAWTAWLSFFPDSFVVAVHARALRVRKAFGGEQPS